MPEKTHPFDSIDEEISMAAGKALAKFDKYYKHMKDNQLYLLASILDPTQKGRKILNICLQDGKDKLKELQRHSSKIFSDPIEPVCSSPVNTIAD